MQLGSGPLIEQSVETVGQPLVTYGFGVPSETGAGVLDLRQLLERLGCWTLALASMNQGVITGLICGSVDLLMCESYARL